MIGCVIGLKTSVTGITIIALGTSLPDTFASRTAAKQDEHADAAIGNVTGKFLMLISLNNSSSVFYKTNLHTIIKSLTIICKFYEKNVSINILSYLYI